MAKKQETLGFIGLGVMGGPMARRLAEAGYSLVVHDINPAALKPLAKLGARVAHSACEVADEATAVFVSLPAPAILREVSLGANSIAMGKKAKIVVDLSTTGSAIEIGRAHV